MTSRRLTVRGVGASPGVATGEIVFRPDEAVARAAAGHAVILVRVDAGAEDVAAIRAAVGVVTTRGGVTGDAAIVARCYGKPCIAGCSAIGVDYARDQLTIRLDAALGGDAVLSKGQVITIDGATGEIRVD
jgi:pyruvate,orthophosphate dikinase